MKEAKEFNPNRIKADLLTAGWTQKKIAQEHSYSAKHIGRVIEDNSQPFRAVREIMSDILKKNINELWPGVKEQK